MSSFNELQIKTLEERLERLTEEYEKASKAYNIELDDTKRLRIQRGIDGLADEIKAVESELEALKTGKPTVSNDPVLSNQNRSTQTGKFGVLLGGLLAAVGLVALIYLYFSQQAPSAVPTQPDSSQTQTNTLAATDTTTPPPALPTETPRQPLTETPTPEPLTPTNTPTPLSANNILTIWEGNFSDASLWNTNQAYWGTIRFPDINGDGKNDLCARGVDGIICAISDGSTFTGLSNWESSFSNDNGWLGDPAYWGTIHFPDVNGDGKADLCARGFYGILCAISNGSIFTGLDTWQGNFSDDNGWDTNPAFWGTIRFPDVNGDGRDDLCARGKDGILCATSDGSTFTGLGTWQGNFSDDSGWDTNPAYWGTIRFPDVNGDGKADLCARGKDGILCAISDGSTFTGLDTWQGNFSDDNGWDTNQAYWGTIRFPDVNGDGKADLCTRGFYGILCAISNGATFTGLDTWQGNFSDDNGWDTNPAYWGTIRFPDVNGDGRDDLCARGKNGILCATSDGATFTGLDTWQSNFSDDSGWDTNQAYWGTIRFPDVNGDGKADLCARGIDGIICRIFE